MIRLLFQMLKKEKTKLIAMKCLLTLIVFFHNLFNLILWLCICMPLIKKTTTKPKYKHAIN